MMAQTLDRRARAVELAMSGASYDRIARELGFANRGNAWRTVQKALKARVDAAVDEYRELELQRLDRLQVALWADAMAGDVAAVNGVLRIVNQRVRLLGLDRAEEWGGADSFALVVGSQGSGSSGSPRC